MCDKLFVVSIITCVALTASSVAQGVIVIDPGPIGTTYTNVDIPFSAFNGTVATGQTINVDFVFPSGIDAVYRYDNVGSRSLYGWNVNLTFQGGSTVTSAPSVFGVVPLDFNLDPVAPYVGTLAFYNAGSTGYGANYNSTFSLASLVAFTDVPYHGLRMTLKLPAYAESGVTVSGGLFGFRRNGSGESTEIIVGVPEASQLLCLTTIGIAGMIGRRSRRS